MKSIPKKKVVRALIISLTILFLPDLLFNQSVAYAIGIPWTDLTVEGVIADLLTVIILGIAGSLLYIAGLIFDFSVYLSITQFNVFINMEAFKTAWTVGRDLVNIILIFTLLYIAIGTILKLFAAKEMLIRVIIIALLINFSGVLTKIVIDASNVLTIELYNKISPGSGIDKFSLENSIGSRFVIALGLQNQGKSQNESHVAGLEQDNYGKSLGQIIFKIFLSAILILVTTFVLLVGAIMLLIRALVFILLYILSPFAIAALVIPGMKEQFKKWWERLISEAIFAPVFMFFIAIVFIIVNDNSTETLTEGINSDSQILFAETLKTIVKFSMLNGLMVSGLIIGKRLGVTGGSLATNKGFSWGKHLVGGVAGYVGARTIGRLGHKVAGSETVQNLKASRSRSAKILGRAIGSVGTVVDKFGFGSGKGYSKRIEARGEEGAKFSKGDIRRRVDYIHNSLNKDEQKEAYKKLSAREKVALENAATGPALKTIRSLKNKLDAEERENVRREHAEFAKTKSNQPLEVAKYINNLDDEGDRRAVYEKLSVPDRIILQKAVEKETEKNNLPPEEKNMYNSLKDAIQEFRNSLSTEEREKTEKYSKGQEEFENKQRLKGQLEKELDPRQTPNPDENTIKKLIRQFKGKDIEQLSPEHLVKVAQHLTIPQLNVLAKSNEINQGTRDEIRGKIVEMATDPSNTRGSEQREAAEWLEGVGRNIF